MKSINIIFPHQLFKTAEILNNKDTFYLIEEFLFFKQYPFHQQKIAFHRASMKAYEDYLKSIGKVVRYIDSQDELSDVRNFHKEIAAQNVSEIKVVDPTDDWLLQRIKEISKEVDLKIYENQQFLNSKAELNSFFRKDKKSFFQTTFYKQQRKDRNILLDDSQEPLGGKWTYDTENRKRYPKGKTPPSIQFPDKSPHWEEALTYVQDRFNHHLGEPPKSRYYPINHEEAEQWFDQFLNQRFYEFGAYEDAIVKEEFLLHHSLLSPLLNTGLLSLDEVLQRTLAFFQKQNVPLNSAEGFIRQLIGWREFIRGMYECKGRFSRSCNFWKFKRKIPASFYDGTTGIDPIDSTIKKVLKTGYCHHIERLMILGNFMLLCEFDPDEVYRWFMELFIDAYDWVMVPNVYGMSQFADGGTFATKPYTSGSNYIRKMGNFKSGEWEKIWDGLFWRFMIKHEEFFVSNPRTSMLVYSLRKMSDDKRNKHLDNADLFLQRISV